MFFSILSSPLPLLLGLAVIRCQDDAFKTIKKRSARFPLPEIYRLWETVLHLVVCGREQLAPPLFRPETRPEYRNGNSSVSLMVNSKGNCAIECVWNLLTWWSIETEMLRDPSLVLLSTRSPSGIPFLPCRIDKFPISMTRMLDGTKHSFRVIFNLGLMIFEIE